MSDEHERAADDLGEQLDRISATLRRLEAELEERKPLDVRGVDDGDPVEMNPLTSMPLRRSARD